MKNKIFTILLSLGFVYSSQATIHTILVGQSGLTFSPSTLAVAVGDTIRYTWVSGSHTSTSVTVPTNATTWSSPVNGASTVFDYIVNVAGTYNYQCNFHAGSGMKGSFSADIAAVNDKFYGIKNSFIIAPNPVIDQATLSFTSDRSFKGSVMLYNATGNLVYEGKLKVESGDNTYTISTDKLEPGVYYVNLLDKNDSFLVEKLIKQ